MTRKNTRTRRGRPSLATRLAPSLEKLHAHVEAGSSVRAAAQLVVKSDEHRIPQGSKHGQRKFQSTVDLLRREYPRWLEKQKRFAELHARTAALVENFEDIRRVLDTPALRKTVDAFASLAKQLPAIDLVPFRR